ncbi:MAG: hypothetical protein ACRDZ7_05195 [Acidimicrobiia bacterium]
MHIDPNLMAVAGIALWLGGAFALSGIARDWSYDRMTRYEQGPLAEVDETAA